MLVKFIEVTNEFNWGKFAVMRFTDEWSARSALDALPLLRSRGWSDEHLLVFDVQTGEGAIFRPGGYAAADLNKHRIWVCPMFQPFLEWLYTQDLHDLQALPALVRLSEAEAPSAFHGYRRPGPDTGHQTKGEKDDGSTRSEEPGGEDLSGMQPASSVPHRERPRSGRPDPS